MLLRQSARTLLVLAVGLPVAAFVAAVSVLHSESGSAWLLSSIPGVQVQSPRGALLGPAFAAEGVRIRLPAGGGEVEIRELAWQGAQWRWWLGKGLWSSASFEQLSAASVRWRPGQSTSNRIPLPADLDLPLQVHIRQLSVGQIALGDWVAVTRLKAAIRLGATNGLQHEIRDLSLEWDRLHLRGEAQVEAKAPMNLRATLDLRQAGDDPQWRAALLAEGPLRALQLQASLQGGPGDLATPTPAPAAPPSARPSAAPGGAKPATRLSSALAHSGLQARMVLSPFEPWPLGEVDLQMRSLDLSELASALPRTRLSGQARLRSSGVNAAFELALQLENTLAGPWNQGRLPIGRAVAEMRATPGSPAIELNRLDLDLGTSNAPGAGRWRSAGRWDRRGLSLEGTAAGLDLRALHSHAPELALSGPLTVRMEGLAAPDASAPPQPTGPVGWEVRGELSGRGGALSQDLKLLLDARASGQRIELQRLEARLGEAQAQVGALAEWAGAAWRVRSQGQLQSFDPRPWMPGDPQAEWRRAPSRLNAGWQLDLALPSSTSSIAALQWLQGLRGQGRLDVSESTIAGVKLQGSLELAQSPGAAPAERRSMLSRWTVGRNQLELRGQGDIAGDGESDRWELQVDAQRLEDLAPLAQWHPAAADWRPQAGRVRARIEAQGRWPQMRTQGEGEIEGVRVGALWARSGRASWVVDTATTQPLQVRGELLDAAWGPNRLALLRGEVQGSWREHRATVEMAAPLVPPAMLERMLALRPGAGTQVRVALDGGWRSLDETSARWSGTLQRLSVASWSGAGSRAAVSADTRLVAGAMGERVETPAGLAGSRSLAQEDGAWVETAGLRTELDFSHDGRLLRAQAAAGSAHLAAGLKLRWDRAFWQEAQPHARFELRAEVEPFAVAPWLNRSETELQWAGDLRMGARLAVSAAENFQLDAELGRNDGDLIVGQDELRQPLGLTEARVSLRVRDGRWTLTPSLKGASLGTVTGAASLTTAAGLRWPAAQSLLDGAIGIDVADLGVWSGWLPPGWRVDGALSTRARLSGRFNAPEITGELVGQGVGVRNLLQGVALRDGELRVALQGQTARIEKLSLRAGDGFVTGQGDASLGPQPSARLDLKAQRLRLLGRIDRQLVASGQAQLRLAPERINLEGRITLDSGLFDLSAQDAPSLDEDVSRRAEAEARRESSRTTAPVPSALMRLSIVNLDVDLGERLRIRGRGLDTSLQGLVRLGSPSGRLAVNGTVRTVGGSYAAYGQKLQIERGVLDFDGRPDQPRLDILALRQNTDMRVGVSISGRANTPRVRLYSEPEMGETDKLSWLVLGRGSEGLARADTTVLQRAAVALLAGEGDAPTDALLRTFGIDELSLRQGEGDVRETVVSLGKQLSRNWFVGYERGVNATAGTWQLIYRLAQRFTLRAQSGTDNSLDLIWTWRFDDRPGERARNTPP